ncbi:hypothetical protein AAFP32_09470 [Brevibacterium sp. CBA3109]|uniref:Uncharacterized protein n=1 Tax=Brevibacterium koreense TaxID=3140787 RepID=A0AAU7UHB7_9MICO
MTDQRHCRFVNPQTTIGIPSSPDRFPLTPHGFEPSVWERHRSPAVTAVRLITMSTEGQIPTMLRGSSLRPEEPLLVGEAIAETPMGEQVMTTLFPSVGVSLPGTDHWPVLMTVIAEIAD